MKKVKMWAILAKGEYSESNPIICRHGNGERSLFDTKKQASLIKDRLNKFIKKIVYRVKEVEVRYKL